MAAAPDAHREPVSPGSGDRWAAALPLVCGVHCLLTPVLVSVLPFLRFEAAVETVILVLSVVLVLGVIHRSRPHHGRDAPLLPALAGLTLWAFSIRGAVGPLPHEWAAALGGGLTAAGAFWNGWLLHRVHCREEGECLLAARSTHEEGLGYEEGIG